MAKKRMVEPDGKESEEFIDREEKSPDPRKKRMAGLAKKLKHMRKEKKGKIEVKEYGTHGE